MKNKFFVLFILLLATGFTVISANAGGKGDLRDINKHPKPDGTLLRYADAISGVIIDPDNIPIEGAEISLFDGFLLKNTKSDSNGVYNILQLPVSAGLMAVLFITKDRYVPSIVSFKRREGVKTDFPVILKRADKEKAGFVGGVIYQPISGGKIQHQSGINGFGREKRVWLENDGIIIETKSNQEGHFIFEVPVGHYLLQAEGSREKPVVEITEGKTVIRNMRSGIILVD
ncbi:MAG: carboxypeptidase regulatory-like domain-containing protein [Nitrospirae bacterium]|nr:carboxypeptidase regulatory-like domain-containing protein [Nitrospirota bacterium]